MTTALRNTGISLVGELPWGTHFGLFYARKAAESGDDGTNDLLVSDVIRTHEMQVWFLSQQLVETPRVRPE